MSIKTLLISIALCIHTLLDLPASVKLDSCNITAISITNDSFKITKSKYELATKSMFQIDSLGNLDSFGVRVKTYCNEICQTYLIQNSQKDSFLLECEYDQGIQRIIISTCGNYLVTYASYDDPDFKKHYDFKSEIKLYKVKDSCFYIEQLNIHCSINDVTIQDIVWQNDSTLIISTMGHIEKERNHSLLNYYKIDLPELNPIWKKNYSKNTTLIDKDVRAIESDTNLVKSEFDLLELIEITTDGGGLLTVWRKEKQIYKIVEEVGLSYGKIKVTIYLKNGKPIKIIETEENYTFTNGALNYNKLNEVYRESIYVIDWGNDRVEIKRIGKRNMSDASCSMYELAESTIERAEKATME